MSVALHDLDIPAGTDRSDGLVRVWLWTVALLVVAIVVVGGATRLTDSGLSITEWAPIRGMLPPLDAADWAAEFELYRRTTEYQTVNRGMSLADFQFIYWWEWGHRFLARAVGLVFALPLAFFWITGRLTPYLKPRLLVLLVLGGLQGFIGWWMVKSGLVDRVDVSQYRLAAHLTMASVIFAVAVWLAASIGRASSGGPRALAWQAAGITLLILAQIAMGAFVAGLDAGLAYNTWPLMDGALVPSNLFPGGGPLSGSFDDVKSVQFLHRMLAYIVWAAAMLHAVSVWLHADGAVFRKGALVIALLVSAQALMGVVTLVLAVPMSWALAHQVGAIVVLGAAVLHLRSLVPATAPRPYPVAA